MQKQQTIRRWSHPSGEREVIFEEVTQARRSKSGLLIAEKTQLQRVIVRTIERVDISNDDPTWALVVLVDGQSFTTNLEAATVRRRLAANGWERQKN